MDYYKDIRSFYDLGPINIEKEEGNIDIHDPGVIIDERLLEYYVEFKKVIIFESLQEEFIMTNCFKGHSSKEIEEAENTVAFFFDSLRWIVSVEESTRHYTCFPETDIDCKDYF